MTNAIRKLSPELFEVARAQCNEDPDLVESYITALQLWLKKSPHLKARTNAPLLLAFLRRCQYSLEETKKRIDGYYSLKTVFPEVLNERLVTDSMLELYRQGVHVIPANPVSASGPRVVISQYSKYDPKKTNPREVFKLFFMLLEILANEDDHASVAGVALVVDARDTSTEQMMQFDPFLLKKTWMLVDRCIPLKFAEIHLINIKREGQAIFNFVTHFLPAKMPFKFIVHKKAEDLYDHLPRDVMTVEYGGHNGYQAEALSAWERKLLEYRNYFEKDATYGTNEKLRLGLCNNWETGELSGLSGSFRKLQVD